MNQASAEKTEKDTMTGSRENPGTGKPGSGKGEAEKKKKGEKPFEKMTKSELIQKIKDLQDQAERNYELYLRSQAEMENMRKRWQREKEEWIKFSNESLIKDLLPPLDALDQAIAHCAITNEDCLDSLKQGVELTLKGLKDALAKAGLEEVKAQGEAFDPNFHQAVSEMEDGSAEPGSVLSELQKGYLLNQRLLRPAMVVVNKKNRGSENEMDE
ncbi:MAG: nucleotide exchange factor GrpE [Deltaproteobacteria bacterium]|nr:MAG: nucleotide exchange factor GrpE [Deltaproteobacteria bacterium]